MNNFVKNSLFFTQISDEKGSKRYSARTRPEHWGSRQSPSPINDQNFNDHLNAPPQEDPLQDALGKTIDILNVS